MGILIFLSVLLWHVDIVRFLSARPNRRTEDAGIGPVVVPEFKLVNVQLKMLLADHMERVDDEALHDEPEALDGVGVNRTSNILCPDTTEDVMPKLRLTGYDIFDVQVHLCSGYSKRRLANRTL